MSSFGCHRWNSLEAVAPFFAWISWSNLSDGSVGVDKPSVVLAMRVACCIVRSSFFHLLVMSSSFLSSPSSWMEANLSSLAARVCVSLVIASFVLGGGFVTTLPVMCCLCRFWHHAIAAGSVDGALLVCRFGISV